MKDEGRPGIRMDKTRIYAASTYKVGEGNRSF
jgi:hypothetical protein